MACKHKFYEYLNLESLDFEPRTLIIGTFNPAWPEANTARWFYGRTSKNSFWEVLPRLYGEESLINTENAAWKQFCNHHKIAITDIIASIKDADPANTEHQKVLRSYSDLGISKHFKEFELVSLTELLKAHPSIKSVYITRGDTDSFWKQKLAGVKEYCQSNGIKYQTLLTPSGFAYFQYGKYKKQNPTITKTQDDFILMRWRELWHPINP